MGKEMFKFVIARLVALTAFYLLIITGVLMSIYEAIIIFPWTIYYDGSISEVIGENGTFFYKDY